VVLAAVSSDWRAIQYATQANKEVVLATLAVMFSFTQVCDNQFEDC